VTGNVKSLSPLVVVIGGGDEISVLLPENASVFRRTKADISAAAVGQTVWAFGAVDGDGYLQAARVYLGETLSMGRFGGGPPRGGMRGGGFRGPFPDATRDEPGTPSSEEERSG
jgi:hypothetical protein